jgi:hypothetical protein
MRYFVAILSLFCTAGCSVISPPPVQVPNPANMIAYANYCEIPFDGHRSAGSVAASGFASVEQQCGIFFDKLAELTQTGRFGNKAIEASSLGTQTIMQAAKAAARSVTIVGASYTIAEAVLNAFIEQYAFSPDLYQIRELTLQAFTQHTIDNQVKLISLRSGFTPDDYCDAAILIQQHSSICTVSSIQSLFDQQVAHATFVVDPHDKPRVAVVEGARLARGASPRAFRLLGSARAQPFTPMVPPNFTVQ